MSASICICPSAFINVGLHMHMPCCIYKWLPAFVNDNLHIMTHCIYKLSHNTLSRPRPFQLPGQQSVRRSYTCKHNNYKDWARFARSVLVRCAVIFCIKDVQCTTWPPPQVFSLRRPVLIVDPLTAHTHILLASVRVLTLIAQASSQHTVHCAFIRVTRNETEDLRSILTGNGR